MNSVHDVISALGGVPDVSRELGAPRSTVAYWAYRGRIPFEWWDPLLAFAEKRGVQSIDMSLMWRLWRPRKKRAS